MPLEAGEVESGPPQIPAARAGNDGQAAPGAKTQSASATRLTVIMPVYNERDTVASVIARVRQVPIAKELIIVDDGSNDGTAQLLDQLAGGEARVIHQPRNMGKGMAIRRALSEITGEVVIIQDADGEYDPAEYPKLMAPIVAGETSVVYGSRFRGRIEGMRWPNYAINRVLAWMVRVLYGAPLTDEATCYKVFRAQVLKSIPLECRGFEFCPEVTAKLLKRGYRIQEVPITYRARTKREGKKINWKDGVRAIWSLIKYRLVG
jgi:glycosyltransferase involved in cell wall biosynthesis